MNKRFIWTVIFLLAIGGTVYFLVRKPAEEETNDEEIVSEEEMENEEEQEEEDTEEEEESDSTSSNTDFSQFSDEEQVLGEESDAVFSIENLDNESKDGYHEFTFLLKSTDADEPFVTASYISSMGVVRLDFQGISGDDSGIGYQEEEAINEQGVLRIYHNISAQSDQELYDIGVSESTVFRLVSESLEDGEWNIILQVKYPGEGSVETDLGSETASTDDQSIEGISSDENASITSYTYGRPSVLLKMVWNVSGTGSNPIPAVNASYNDDHELVVTFPSLSMDKVVDSFDSTSLTSTISVTGERDGETSIYTFSGLDEDRSYKLSATLSPNQVILEIE